MAFEDFKVRSYDGDLDRARLELLERRCEVGPSQHVFLFTDTMGDPISRIRNSPMYIMLVAELNHELIGAIQGSIKVVTMKDLAKVGYILGLRVSPLHRRKGIGLSLVQHLEEWFIGNQVEYAYMATEKDNNASVNLFVNKLHYVKFRRPAILVHPVRSQPLKISSKIEIFKINEENAEYLYRRYMGLTEFFPADIDKILTNKLSLGTWVACDQGGRDQFGQDGIFPTNWAMLSVWDSGGIFKLRIGKAPVSCLVYSKVSKLIDKVFACFNMPALLCNMFEPFGFYFLYGVHHEGPVSGNMVRALCKYVHNMARVDVDCKMVVTEVGSYDERVRPHIPHWRLLSCLEDLWCIKALKSDERESFNELTRIPQTKPLFVDPREV
ncbi:putative transcription regulator GNAT family [Helianthus annuus]|uniref:Putative acyl-CoA N-acyltransferases (NAT) superfamily protein n=1 Tax=Helianthus annuus TaxID=4232 RepID=A0A251TBF2_HELAN|nr:probable N-acetyltransferase HLS1-like [Helianthus annuus]KAF5782213.1 putative transcription regulator GNAT family [Helianthus annuus]KAJ0501716.1 putative transcription regulator GNAT family [Helianthus annuus]KAJ0517636.1 putative transcription regulator GNAT family [Helianthus annuus]KAJ0685650.1 putative transcription regulator GNAT family [Helianthus annuus]KAJ0689539.1 putative transcription regulator GNAT family [Helianthus annuus]